MPTNPLVPLTVKPIRPALSNKEIPLAFCAVKELKDFANSDLSILLLLADVESETKKISVSTTLLPNFADKLESVIDIF